MPPPRLPRRATALVAAYLVVGTLWILFSDQLVNWLAADAGQAQRLQTYKGLAFVLLTGLVLVALLRLVAAASAAAAAAEAGVSYRQMFHANPQPMWIYEVATLRFLDVNAAAVALYGYSREELLHMNLADLRPPEDVPAMHAAALRAQANPRASASGPWRHRCKDGRLIRVRVSSHALEFGGRSARLVLATDVSETLALQESLERHVQELGASRERLQRAMELGGVALWERDLRSDTLVMAGPWAEMLGSTPERFGPVTAASFDERCHPGDLAPARQRLLQYLKSPAGPYRDEFRLRHDDGHWVWMLSQGRIAERDAEGRALYMVGTVVDVSALKAAQAAREAGQAALRASALQAEFLAQLGHELGTPLNAVLGYAQLLQRDPAAPLAPGQRERAGRIETAGRHMVALIRDLAELSRLEAGAVTLKREPVDAAALIDEGLALLEPDRQARGLSLARELAPDLPLVAADPTRLRQVLLNLLSNALKYGRRDGALRVSARQASDGMVEIAVWNSGAGLTAAQRERLFEPFNRLGRDTGPEEGSGLGLALSRRLVERMGGRIEVRSEPGAWAEFLIHLPVHA